MDTKFIPTSMQFIYTTFYGLFLISVVAILRLLRGTKCSYLNAVSKNYFTATQFLRSTAYRRNGNKNTKITVWKTQINVFAVSSATFYSATKLSVYMHKLQSQLTSTMVTCINSTFTGKYSQNKTLTVWLSYLHASSPITTSWALYAKIWGYLSHLRVCYPILRLYCVIICRDWQNIH